MPKQHDKRPDIQVFLDFVYFYFASLNLKKGIISQGPARLGSDSCGNLPLLPFPSSLWLSRSRCVCFTLSHSAYHALVFYRSENNFSIYYWIKCLTTTSLRFFVLSGFLITLVLEGRPASLSTYYNFYFKRLRRILPLALLVRDLSFSLALWYR